MTIRVRLTEAQKRMSAVNSYGEWTFNGCGKIFKHTGNFPQSVTEAKKWFKREFSASFGELIIEEFTAIPR